MDEPTPTKRRWFRFSLRTMFVLVTVLCIWLGHSLTWIRQRHAVFHRHHPPLGMSRNGIRTDYANAPWSIRLLGEPGAVAILLKRGTNAAERERIQELFPEAKIYSLPLRSIAKVSDQPMPY
jgi:hypothetical protein